MIWSFTRGAAQIDVEVHRGAEPDHYTLAVTYPDGAERIEHFDKASKLVTRYWSNGGLSRTAGCQQARPTARPSSRAGGNVWATSALLPLLPANRRATPAGIRNGSPLPLDSKERQNPTRT
jgi:hypothetical protein